MFKKTDAQVQQDVLNELKWDTRVESNEVHADRDAARLRIDIERGQVTLHGDVHSWADRQAIIGAVTGTRGVDSVIDRLHIG